MQKRKLQVLPVASEFYAALIEDSYHVEGDERSKTNPGHGYPAHDVKYTRVEEFSDEEAMQLWVQQQESKAFSRLKYRIVKCTPMTVSVTTEVKVSVK